MSAPQTNMEKQTRRHRWPLIGMAVAVIFGTFLIVSWLFGEAAESENPAAAVTPGSADIETAPQVIPQVTPPAGGTSVQPPASPAAPAPAGQ